MNRAATISAILGFCRNMPNPERHRRYLDSLTDAELQRRLTALAESEQSYQRRRAGWHRQTTLVPT